MPLEVFHAPATLREQLIEFQARQQCYPLSEMEQHKEELAGYVGVKELVNYVKVLNSKILKITLLV